MRELEHDTVVVCAAISPAAVREVYHSVTRCRQQSTDANGGHLENL
jgi:hypothetical protein